MPGLAILNEQLAFQLGLDADWLSQNPAFFCGNCVPEGASPLAQAYAGHQFGNFTKLGDGRAILLGEHIAPDGCRFDIQLKGAGRTPFSRGGDGRAALGPMLREYIISEAMHALGIPTTRSLAVATTGEPVFRDGPLPGAVLTRIAASHIRVGTFEWAAAAGDANLVGALADYAIERHFPRISDSTNRYVEFFEAVMERQAALIAKWMQVGFIHGVMNTDNMSISGESIDYGPCAFMDSYHPEKVFSSIDRNSRYAFANQPRIAHWNLARFAETLLPFFFKNEQESIEVANAVLPRFSERFAHHWMGAMRGKLGLFNEEPDDRQLVEMLLKTMHENGSDFTNTFINLHPGTAQSMPASLESWHAQWRARLARQPQSADEVVARMQAHNPAAIPRNHKVEEALAAATEDSDLKPLHRLLAALEKPFDHSISRTEFQGPPPASSCEYRTFCGT
jgi:serine/tyrosine/threonine adenylyltransferase